MNLTAVRAIASQRFKESIRAKWLGIFALVFFLLAIDLPTLVLITVNLLQIQYLETYLTSLVTVSFPFIPLLALPMGSMAIVDEREAGTMQFTLSNPISKEAFLLGNALGLLLATTAVILLGYGIASVLVYSVRFSNYGRMIAIMLIGVCLNVVMLGIALVVSVLSKRKTTAIGIAIFVWFLFAVITEVGFLAFVVNASVVGTDLSPIGPLITVIITLLNPLELARVLSALVLQGGVAQLGTTGAIMSAYLHQSIYEVIYLGFFGWISVSFLSSFLLFHRQDSV